jgi:GcrA cell cycle regulator
MVNLWSAQQTEIFRTMWTDGATCREIANTLGVSKNAVVGKRARLKLPGRPNPAQQRGPRGRYGPRQPHPPASDAFHAFIEPTKTERVKVKVSAIPRIWHTPKLRRITKSLPLEVLTSSQCHWPLTADRPFLFCAAPASPKQPYCPVHRAMAYMP